MLSQSIKYPLIFSLLLLIVPLQSPSLALFNYTLCKKEIAEFSGKKTYPLNSLHEIKNLDDLSKFSLTTPNEHDHKKGIQLILLALKGNPETHANWVLAHALLGISMLDANKLEKEAYQSLFMSLTNFRFYKMSKSQNILLLLNNKDNPIETTSSLITRRELIISLISRHIHNRFTYNEIGNFKKIYTPDKNRKAHNKLKNLLKRGLTLYENFEDQEFDDSLLRDTLGIAYAVLSFDSVDISTIDLRYLEPYAIYKDALKITLDSLKKRPTHGYEFLIMLSQTMERKKLSTKDPFLFTNNKDMKNTIKTIIETDLNKLYDSPTKNKETIIIPSKNINKKSKNTLLDPLSNSNQEIPNQNPLQKAQETTQEPPSEEPSQETQESQQENTNQESFENGQDDFFAEDRFQ